MITANIAQRLFNTLNIILKAKTLATAGSRYADFYRAGSARRGVIFWNILVLRVYTTNTLRSNSENISGPSARRITIS